MTGQTRLMSAAPRCLQTPWHEFQFQGGTSHTVVSRFALSEVKIKSVKEDLCWGAELVRNVRLSTVLSSLVVRDSLLFVYILASHADVWRGVWWGSRENLFKKGMMRRR